MGTRLCPPANTLASSPKRASEATVYHHQPTVTYTSAVHIAHVEVDPDTGAVRLLRYVVAHDCGKLINPMIVEGQIHGGVAQGVGGGLLEEMVYDEQGQLLTGTFMDYLVPTAMELPAFTALRLAKEPIPNGMAAVSPPTTVTHSSGMPSASAATCANEVSCPCPWLHAPVATTARPERSMRTLAPSYGPMAVPST